MTQLYVGPDFREVATELLRISLQALYPTLDIDPSITMVGTPGWTIIDGQIVAGPPSYQTLTDILANQAVLAVPALYIAGEHFLTRQPIYDPAIHLPVRIDEIANLLNLLAPVMLGAYQEQQVEYWNKTNADGHPRWHELASTLRNLWNVDQVEGWNAADCQLARDFFNTPGRAERALDGHSGKAFLIDSYLVDEHNIKHPNKLSIAVLMSSDSAQTDVLTYSLFKGYEKFASLDAFAAALPAHANLSGSFRELQWRLWEPDGNFFEQQACRLISMQVDAIGALDFTDLRYMGPVDRSLRSSAPAEESIGHSGADVEWFRNKLPEWLKNAPLSELNNYSRHLKDLAALHSLNAGKTYLDDIPSIQQYALDRLKQAMLKKHPDAATLDLEKIEMRIKSLVIWGTFIVPGKFERTTLSLTDLALQNLIAVPLGDKTLHSTQGTALPAWLTVAYVESLVKEINIGSDYPALIKQKLVNDPEQARLRQSLYSQHLRIQLPLLALQNKIRSRANIDTLGYRYVCALMEPDAVGRTVEGQPIVIRPLAFLPQRQSETSPDIVANMFVIGPQDPSTGPCLLYRPMLDQPLTQYPSPSNLIYAIQQSASLRDSVLAWMADDVRSDYANYVFPGALPSPWIVADFLVDPDKVSRLTGPLNLAGTPLDADPFSALFKANTDALIELADRQSVSNAESRWASFKQAGWLIFSAVLPFLGRTVGVAAWIWQIMDQLQELTDAAEQQDDQARSAAFIDVLLNLGMAITLHIATHRSSARRPVTIDAEFRHLLEKRPLTLKKLPALAPNALPDPDQTLQISGAVNRSSSALATLLDSFKISKPVDLGARHAEEGHYQNLYKSGHKWYAPVGQRWFEVSVDNEANVSIIDPQTPERAGPLLIGNRRGEWFIDMRLRLRGGGSKRLTLRAALEASEKAAKLRTLLSAFEQQKTIAQSELKQALDAMTSATPGTAATKRQLYLQKLESQRAAYKTALQNLQNLQTLQVFAPTPDYLQRALGYQRAQLELIHAGIREAATTFTPQLRTVLRQIEQQESNPHLRNIEDAHLMSGMNRDMIERLEQIQTRINELKSLEKEGLRLIQTNQARLPAFSIDDLRALQITMARNLCLTQTSITTQAEAWSTLDRIVDTADIAVQALRDSLEERSANRIDERIESLNGLLEQFSVIDDRLQDLRQAYAAHVVEEPFKQLRQALDALSKRGAARLVQDLDERDAARSRPSLPVQPPRPKKKFIRTRYNGVLIGEPRLSALGLDTGLVDITSPLTHRVIATFHEKSPGIWVERLSTPTEHAAPVDLQTSLNSAQKLLDAIPAFKVRMLEHASQNSHTPAGVEYLYQEQAIRLEHLSAAIEQALTEGNVTENTTLSASRINKNLNDAVEALYQQAIDARLKMTRQQDPTPAGVEWLKNKKAITVKRTVSRRRLKAARRIYLDEYTITDRTTREVLWYAHFHYSQGWTTADAYLYARLKTPTEYAQGLAADSAKGLNDAKTLTFYRSMIGTEQARRLFFTAA
ncbi:hypothetical protein ACIOZM_10970 [Pseudomonas sp. NPDC087346]|uniref:hypothetical protein n=1 Tax=Pseudomonas sp. NPDC087346 TaxID=3364438 RepID=UPI0037F35314